MSRSSSRTSRPPSATGSAASISWVSRATPGRTRTASTATSSRSGPGGEPASRIDLVQREVLDAYRVDIGLLTGDVGVDRVADAEPLPGGGVRPRAQRLAGRPLARRRAAPARLDPGARPGPGGRGRRDRAAAPAIRGSRRCCWSAAPSGPTASRGTCRSSRRRPTPDCRSRSTPAARGWGSPRPPGGAGYAELLHRVAHARLGRQHHGAPGVADLPRHVRPACPACGC